MVYESGVTNGGVMPDNLYTGSSGGVSGWASNAFSQRVADDIDGSKLGAECDHPRARRIVAHVINCKWNTGSASGRVVESNSYVGSSCNFLKTRSQGSLGMRRIRAPRGRDTKPSASDMIHSRAPMRVTSKAEPPIKQIDPCTATSD